MATQGQITPEAPDATLAPGTAPSSARLDQLGIATPGERGTSQFPTGTAVGTVNGVANGGLHVAAGDPVQRAVGSAGDVDTAVYAAVRAANGTKAAGQTVSSTYGGATIIGAEGAPGQPQGTPNNKYAPSFGGTHGYSNNGVAS